MACSFVGFLEETNQPEPARHTIDSKLPFPCGAPQILEDLMKIQAAVAHSATPSGGLLRRGSGQLWSFHEEIALRGPERHPRNFSI
ncbi:hypothetical protein ACIP1V_12255 [Kocuria marina]|uniref:hypothetical protein n=1 Tax=Kocuria marina TaxID=223184 RepID=UPI0037F7A5F2